MQAIDAVWALGALLVAVTVLSFLRDVRLKRKTAVERAALAHAKSKFEGAGPSWWQWLSHALEQDSLERSMECLTVALLLLLQALLQSAAE